MICDYLVTYVPVFAGAQSKLALFTAICAFCWAVHGGYMPHVKVAPLRVVQMRIRASELAHPIWIYIYISNRIRICIYRSEREFRNHTFE